MSIISLLAFVVSPVMRLKPDRLSDREVKLATQLAKARDETIKLRAEVNRLTNALIEQQLDRCHAVFDAAPQLASLREADWEMEMIRLRQQQLGAQHSSLYQAQMNIPRPGPGVWCNCVPSRSQVWAAGSVT